MTRARHALTAVAALLTLLLVSACGASPPEQDSQSGSRVITHAMGKTTITGTPQRVVVLGTGELDAVLSLGVKPVGLVRPSSSSPLQPYLADKVRDVPMVGTIKSPDLEKITKLKPDLILSSKVRNAERYETLSRIAPTVLSETVGKTWKQNLRLAGEALGKKQQAQRILDRYQAKADSIGARIGDPGKTEVSMVRFLSGGTIRLYGKGSFIGTILSDVGFSRPPNQRVDKTYTKISRELVSQADGDLLFHAAYGSGGKAHQEEVTRSVQWKSLSAVRDGKASKVSDGLWYLGLGPIAANLVLDDLAERVAPK
ncbi:iron complex transport system substrate-binding protein [Saccharopolyspora lacisalsi]|uniref:Iron complex transport system substrate-binding protein n=1 Tax=Halosaccharopolyspora lacisalsi TaxID=1000566 RepID=A0A839E0J1_9PSEU|nr:iron-siderophore ABC transporter substrate-binding protein [Halosaccharopolyspora lacisalsi]MBA8826803.1 iron complex transport system substrate-binding protein [Halosaccharopolyspora lacisalsi]